MTPASRARAFVVGMRLLLLAMFCAVGWGALDYGLRLRRWAWDETDLVHFYPDMNNGIRWGANGNQPTAHPRGFLNVYDRVANAADKRNNNSPDYQLDYAPLRLLLITRWEGWAARKYPDMIRVALEDGMRNRTEAWHPPYAFYAPMLGFNDGTEIAGAIGLFLLARYWVLRGGRRWGSTSRGGTAGAILRPYRGALAGAVAAMLFWFNPAVILSSHGWPTWDEWIIPFFVWTVYLCCIDWWFTAGVVLAIGAMFKGQQLFVAPMFVLWPIFIGRPFSALRWTAGLFIGVALPASPWLLTYVPGGVTPETVSADRRIDHSAVCFILLAIVLVALPAALGAWLRIRRRRKESIEESVPHCLSPLLSLLIRQVLPALRIVYGPLAVLTLATSSLLCPILFHGSLNWLYIGWGYGTRHYLNMVQGLSDNLAGLLSDRFGWDNLTDLVYTMNAHPLRLWPTHTVIFTDPLPITIRMLLVGLYFFFFALCVIGMAIHYRRNDPRFLVATTAVWLMFFAFMPQIHERYLLYAAGVGCSFTAVSFGFVLLDLFLTALTFIMTFHVMLTVAAGNGGLFKFANEVSPTFGRRLFWVINGTHPDAAWALLLCTAIFLYHVLVPSPPMRRPNRFRSGLRARLARHAASC